MGTTNVDICGHTIFRFSIGLCTNRDAPMWLHATLLISTLVFYVIYLLDVYTPPKFVENCWDFEMYEKSGIWRTYHKVLYLLLIQGLREKYAVNVAEK